MWSHPNRIVSAPTKKSINNNTNKSGSKSSEGRRSQSADRKKRPCKCKACTLRREEEKPKNKSVPRRSQSTEELDDNRKPAKPDSPKTPKTAPERRGTFSKSLPAQTDPQGWFIPAGNAQRKKDANQIVTELRAEALQYLTDKRYPDIELKVPTHMKPEAMQVIELDPVSLSGPQKDPPLSQLTLDDMDPFQFSRSNTEYTCCSSILFQEMTDYLNESLDAPEDPWPSTSAAAGCLKKDVINSKLGSRVDNTPGDMIQWKRGQMLGRGAFGTVWCGLTMTGEMIAVKQSDISGTDIAQCQREYEKIQSEVDMLKSLNHNNIVAYLGTSMTGATVSIFMQYIPGGCLASIMRKFGSLSEPVCSRYARQILSGVAYLHGKGIIHRDIKGSNIMLMPNGVVKLIDFGCAQRLLHLNQDKVELSRSMKGTPYWMAPEVINEGEQGSEVDIWSIGCTIVEMLCGRPPWAHLNKYAALYALSNGTQPTLPENISPDAREIVLKCMQREPKDRPSASTLLHHSFIVLHENVLKNCIHDKHGHPRKSAKQRPTPKTQNNFRNPK